MRTRAGALATGVAAACLFAAACSSVPDVAFLEADASELGDASLDSASPDAGCATECVGQRCCIDGGVTTCVALLDKCP